MPFEDATEGVTASVTVAFVDLDGGGHRNAGLLARGLARLGHHVVHYAPTHQAPPGPGRYEQVRMAGGEDGTAGSSDRWELGRADVVHAFCVRSTATARAMIAESAIPLVADWCSYATAAHSVPEADHYTVTGKAEATGLAGRGVARPDIGIVVDTVDDELRRTQNETSAAAGRPRLLCHSRLRPEDGTDTAIAALRWLPEAELVVVHGGTVTSGGASRGHPAARRRPQARRRRSDPGGRPPLPDRRAPDRLCRRRGARPPCTGPGDPGAGGDGARETGHRFDHRGPERHRDRGGDRAAGRRGRSGGARPRGPAAAR